MANDSCERAHDRRSSLGKFAAAFVMLGALCCSGIAPAAADVPPAVSADPQIGSPAAKATLVVWFDYQCPYCKLFWRDTLPRLNDTYVRTGKLRIVFRDFQFLGPDSATAALFARAVWELYPARFYDWSRAMFGAQDQENGGFGNLASIQELTRHISGIDVARVTARMKDRSKDYAAAIVADYNDALAMGVNGTPTVIVNGNAVSGSESFDSLAKLIDRKLKH
ncbi:MAG: thioredoxin domain-containing protein [Rhizomicrobium sp.]|jgi:protein-disulfide isomerase